MPKIIERWSHDSILHALNTRRILLLLGARQCGKTTLAKSLSSLDMSYRTLDDPTLLQSAKSDPEGFVQHKTKTLIIDEVQRAPDLLLAVKKEVDENTRYGQYLLTGSTNITSLPQVMESLAGRVRKIRLRPLTQGEILGNAPRFLTDAFNEAFRQEVDPISKSQLLGLALRGGYPEVVALDKSERRAWHLDYMEALLERDLRDIVNIQNKEALYELVHILAAWSSKLMDVSDIGRGLAIKRPTVESYISSLELLYIVERVKPWTNTDYDRVGKKSTLFFTDSGLMAALLNWHKDTIRFDGEKSGKLIETFAFNEIAAQIDLNRNQYSLRHYRDREQREIDFIVERNDGAILGIEVKGGSALNQKSFRHLKWFQENLAKERPFIGIVLYSGKHIAPFGKNLWAVPFSMLWS